MAITFRGARSDARTGSGGVSCFPGEPTTQVGDTLLAFSWSDTTNLTIPTGWTEVGVAYNPSPGNVYRLFTKPVLAGHTATMEWANEGGSKLSVTVVAYGGVRSIDVVGSGATSSPSLVAPSVAATVHGCVIVRWWLVNFWSGTYALSAGQTSRHYADDETPQVARQVADKLQTAAGPTGTATLTGNGSGAAYTVALAPANTAPNAPTLTSPPSAAVINRSSANRFTWDFSDPDVGDSQSKFDLRHRLIGAATWTVVSGTTSNEFWDAVAGTFAAGDYEWQVRTYDALGAVGPYSPSSFFTAADAPSPASITSPINGSTVGQAESVAWSTPDQSAYQVRRVADSAGTADTATVYYDSGEVTSITARSHALDFATNGRFEHVQVRIKQDGIWSAWASVRVEVSYTEPPAPTLVVAIADTQGAYTVGITNPEPVGDQPAVVYNNVFVRTAESSPVADSHRPHSEDGTRIAVAKPLNGVLIDWLGASGVVYEYQVEAVATNDTTAFSAWTAVDPAAEPTIHYGGAY